MNLYIYDLKDYDEAPIFDVLSKEYNCKYSGTVQPPTVESAVWAKGCEAVSVIASTLADEVLDKWAEIGVKYISTRSIGVDHINLEKCRTLGIRVGHAQYSPNSVANYAIMLMLMVCRKITHILKRSELQDYSVRGKIGKELSLCTVGVIGTGRIGKTVIKHLEGFGCRILAYDVFPSEEVAGIAEYVSFEELIRHSDIITLHAPATEDNYHMIDASAIAKMKDGVILINAARGALVDLESLIDGLESEKIGGAALDVLENEGGLYFSNHTGEVLHNHEMAILQSFPNVIVTPHTAYYTQQAVYDISKCVFQFIHACETGETNHLEV